MDSPDALPQTPQETETNRPVILVVDDEVGPRESLKMILNRQHDVVVAENGLAGLMEFQDHRPALVISDLRMPGMDGIEMMRRVKERSPDTPFIVLTGCGTLESAQQAIRAGAFDYISKPYNIVQIRDVVARGLAKARGEAEILQTIARLRVMNTQLERQMRDQRNKAALGELSAQMVHDLNNPLFVLQGYVTLLENSLGQRGAEEEEELECIEMIHEQIDRCARLTQGFLAHAREPENGWGACNVNGLIEDALFLLRLRIRSAGIDLEEELAPDLPLAEVHEVELQQVFYNLISNAIQAMEATGGNLLLASDLATDEAGHDCVEILVSDSGPGIPHDIQERIFGSYFTTRQDSNGTGLGLAICKRVVDEHAGTIVVESEPGNGATFRVRIPLWRHDLSGRPKEMVAS